MAKMREVILGQSELEVQRKFNEWQKRMAGRVSEVDGRLERIKRPQGSGKVAGVDTHMMIVRYNKKAPSRNPRR